MGTVVLLIHALFRENKMKQPLVALLISPDERMRNNIVSGTKTITIRDGHRDYRRGQTVMLCCHFEPWAVMADIKEVRHCLLSEVTQKELQDDGFKDVEDMLNGMRRYYPALEHDSPVTVIRWENARGKLVDGY